MVPPPAPRHSWAVPELTIFYDGGCPACRREKARFERLDRDRRLEWRDVIADPSVLTQAGVSLRDALTRMHVRHEDGRLESGAYAFVAIWDRVPGWRWLARMTRLPGLLPVADRIYDWYAARRARDSGCAECGPTRP